MLRAGVWPQLGAGWNCALLDWLQSGALGRPALQPSQHRPTLNILHSYNTAGTIYSIWYFYTTCQYNTETQNTIFKFYNFNSVFQNSGVVSYLKVLDVTGEKGLHNILSPCHSNIEC